MRIGFLGSLITATQRQFLRPSIVYILLLIACLITPSYVLFLFSSLILNILTMQYNMSVIINGIIFFKRKDVKLLG